MNNYDEVIRMLRELTEELKHDNDKYDNTRRTETNNGLQPRNRDSDLESQK